MSAAVTIRSQTKTNGVPFTQNTAPVIEFRCLYTHDIRRKAKRWQDGFLKFHTFNKRVMVYDVPRNFIGDMHWKDQGELQEGDEITLECAVLVQVNEPIDRTETDLTPLFQKRDKSSAQKQEAKKDMSGQSALARRARSTVQSQKRHKSLHALLGDPKGPHDKAVLLNRSPYEVRSSDAENDWPDKPSLKRRRIDTPCNGQQNHRTPQRSRREHAAVPACKSTVKPQNVIEISSDTERPSSDGWVPGPTMPPLPSNTKNLQQQALRRIASSRRTDVPTVRLARSDDNTHDAAPLCPSPPVSTTNKTHDSELRVASPKTVLVEEQDSDFERPAGKPLKVGKKAARNMLMCQAVPQKRLTPRAKGPDHTEKGTYNFATNGHAAIGIESRDRDRAPQKTDRDRLHDRIALIGKKKPRQYTDPSSELLATDDAQHLPAPDPNDPDLLACLPTDDLDFISSCSDQQLQPPCPSPRPNQHRSFNRARSKNDKPDTESKAEEPARAGKAAAVVESAVPKRSLRTSKSFAGPQEGAKGGETNMIATGRLGEKGSKAEPDVNRDLGPWSKEAWDLFDWRPPDRDEHGKKIVAAGG
ncbi:MAG: hypothetical protein M1821_001698 [Bathelium mastoideum]|nr:MAG: hypothetical protein M1821_001698 [Bathelium mastoideum]KAI9691590.1 MAG: hypothetical protein M1822_007661 [Bathelium mastoideum]